MYCVGTGGGAPFSKNRKSMGRGGGTKIEKSKIEKIYLKNRTFLVLWDRKIENRNLEGEKSKFWAKF